MNHYILADTDIYSHWNKKKLKVFSSPSQIFSLQIKTFETKKENQTVAKC